MRPRDFFALLGLLAALLALARPADEAQAAPLAAADTQEVQDVVFFSASRPLLVRLRVRIDGKPFQAVWEAYMDALFGYLDVDGDGYLSREEAAAAPPAQALFTTGFFGGRLPPVRGMDRNGDGKVSRAELADYYRRNGAAPFQLRYGGERGPRDGILRLTLDGRRVGEGPPSADAVNDRLFQLLDRDGDGKLSRAELARGPEVLAKLDADDDEMLTVAELLGNSAPAGGNGGGAFALAFAPNRNPMPVSAAPFHVVTPGPGEAALAKRLLERYGAKGARKLSAKELGLDKATFDRLDADGDGALDAEELARFARRAPDLELAVRLGKRGPGQALVEPLPPKGRPSPLARHLKKGTGGVPMLELDNTHVEFRGPAPAPKGTVRTPFNVRQQYINQFKAADKDGNGYLDIKEARQSPFFRDLFQAMDRNRDGKLYLQEVLAYYDKMKELSDRATASVVTLHVSDQGRGLFDLLDADKDGRLSVRELRQLPKLIDRLDRDGDGLLSRGEVPRAYRATFELGPADFQQASRVIVRARGGLVEPPPPRRAEGPLWFWKMDRNRDGDVSRREFLGTDEEFRRIDTDGDGLISLAEALAFDKKVRAARSKGRQE
jgi:Ca2+-binding EF-hand superfamily protein